MTISPEQREAQDDMKRIIRQGRQQWRQDVGRWRAEIQAADWEPLKAIVARRPDEDAYIATALREAGYRKADALPVKPVELVEDVDNG